MDMTMGKRSAAAWAALAAAVAAIALALACAAPGSAWAATDAQNLASAKSYASAAAGSAPTFKGVAVKANGKAAVKWGGVKADKWFGVDSATVAVEMQAKVGNGTWKDASSVTVAPGQKVQLRARCKSSVTECSWKASGDKVKATYTGGWSQASTWTNTSWGKVGLVVG